MSRLLLCVVASILLLALVTQAATPTPTTTTATKKAISKGTKPGKITAVLPGSCPNGCSNHGICTSGICKCVSGFGGVDCSIQLVCPNSCSNHGICNKGICACEPYYTGSDCSKIDLPVLTCPKWNGRDCAGNGLCLLGQCFCEASFTGYNCADVVQNCPKNCGGSSHGTCRFGKCFCEPGFTGETCETVKKCSDTCLAHGICIKGECKCALGFTGADCSQTVPTPARQAALEHDLLNSVVSQTVQTPPVPRPACGLLGKPCSEHGMCIGSTCVCEAGFGGQNCSTPMNAVVSTDCGAAGCSSHGECVFGTCVCLPGYGGRNCEQTSFIPCPNDCSSQGLCYLGVCECHPGFDGVDCSAVKSCPAGCVHGACVQGICECVYGFSGNNCTDVIPAGELPPKDYIYLSSDGLNTCGSTGCGAHGVCLANQCVCVEGYTGVLCDVPIAGYTPRPSTAVTPANPAVSDIFGTMSCTINCGVHGVCVGGTCTCVDGWADAKCSTQVPEVKTYQKFAAAKDFLSIMTAQKKLVKSNKVAIATPTTTPATGTKTALQQQLAAKAAASKSGKTSLMESHSTLTETNEEGEVIPTLHRNTAILAPVQPTQWQSKYSPDATQTVGADPNVLSSAPNQVNMNQAAVSTQTDSYTMTMNPWLMSFLCFMTGVVVTISLKCLLDKRDDEKRKMKKMEELLQPSS